MNNTYYSNYLSSGYPHFNNIMYETDIVVGIKDNYSNILPLYELVNNVYLINDEMKNAKLFNMPGQEVMQCKDAILDLNFLPIGIYLLQYIENNQTKIIKLIRK